jgi:hypothetical protein
MTERAVAYFGVARVDFSTGLENEMRMVHDR